MVRQALYRECAALLEENGVEDAEFDTLCIFQDMLGDKTPLFKPNEEVAPETESRIRQLISERCTGRPLQYILGEWEFWGLPIKVGEGVLIPRPDTETAVEKIVQLCRKRGMTSPRIIDLCSGSGCIALALEHEFPLAEVYAAELSESALKYLRANAALNNSAIKIVKGDVLSAEFADPLGKFDVIVSNPPYLTAAEMNDLQREVRREPDAALYGGHDGLDFYRAMTPVWKNALKSGGIICYEFGMGQHDAVADILRKNNFENIELTKDGGGIIRIVSANTPVQL